MKQIIIALLLTIAPTVKAQDSLQIYKDSVAVLNADIEFADTFIKDMYTKVKADPEKVQRIIKEDDSVLENGARLILRIEHLLELLKISLK